VLTSEGTRLYNELICLPEYGSYSFYVTTGGQGSNQLQLQEGYLGIRTLFTDVHISTQYNEKHATHPCKHHYEHTAVIFSLYGPKALWTLAAFSVSHSYTQSAAFPGREISRKAATYTEQTQTDIHASSDSRSHDPSVQAGEDGSCLRPRGQCDRLFQ
jgi:hypothetical protein